MTTRSQSPRVDVGGRRRLEANFFAILRSDTLASGALAAAEAADRAIGLPNWRVASGVLYNAVWNALDGQRSGYGVKDVDVLYHDPSDLTWEAEDRVIRAATPFFAAFPVPVEIRNQARVHLWYEARFGRACPAYRSVEHAIDHFASRAHAVGVRCAPDGTLDLYAPFGLADIFARCLRPNRTLANAETHAAKAARIKSFWPATRVEPW